MKELKTRSLNELRQTKDAHYVVPKVNKKNRAEEALQAFIQKNDHNVIGLQLKEFIEFLDAHNYKIYKR
jgi:phage pi2 protein 07